MFIALFSNLFKYNGVHFFYPSVSDVFFAILLQCFFSSQKKKLAVDKLDR
jgi:hypothetical protein